MQTSRVASIEARVHKMGTCIGRCPEQISEQRSLIESTRSKGSPAPTHGRTLEQERARDAELHYQSGGAQGWHSMSDSKSTPSDKTTHRNYSGPKRLAQDEEQRAVGLEESDSGVHSRSSLNSPKRAGGKRPSKIVSTRGKRLCEEIRHAYKLKDRFNDPKQEFLREMDKLFMEVQLHLTELSAKKSSQKEADVLVDELVALRNHWGPKLLPNTVCNAFVRERIQVTIDNTHYRIDCAQFFEPVPFYSTPAPTGGELMKLYRFSVYEMNRNEVVMRYYLERSNVVQLYHVLCFACGNHRGQVHPYGTECPSYWVLRECMLQDVCRRVHDLL